MRKWLDEGGKREARGAPALRRATTLFNDHSQETWTGMTVMQWQNNREILTEYGTPVLTRRPEACRPTAAFSHCIRTQHVRNVSLVNNTSWNNRQANIDRFSSHAVYFTYSHKCSVLLSAASRNTWWVEKRDFFNSLLTSYATTLV